MTGDVLILGAGFSKAISSEMPMTRDLGEEVINRLRALRKDVSLPSRSLSGPQLEAWLSRLAEPQPDLSAASNLANQSLFLSASEVLRDVIIERQTRVLANELPWWLRRMLGTLHYSLATVVTFNYDTLIETAVGAAQLFDDESTHVYPGEIIRHMPAAQHGPSRGLSFGTPRANTFRYLKLHGSVDTFWIPGDASGASIGRWELPGTWGAPSTPDDRKRRQVFPGTEAYIVPPAAAKSSFYTNPLAREVWRTTAEALAEAKRVAIIGYSMPVTDMVTSGMLADVLSGTTSEVTVVNPVPVPVVDRLEELGIARSRIRQVSGDQCVQQYAEELERQFELPAVPSTDGNLLLTLGWGGTPRFAVKEVLGVSEDGVAQVAAGTDQWASASLRARELFGPVSPTRVEVAYENGRRALVTRIERSNDTSGPQCLVLSPNARP